MLEGEALYQDAMEQSETALCQNWRTGPANNRLCLSSAEHRRYAVAILAAAAETIDRLQQLLVSQLSVTGCEVGCAHGWRHLQARAKVW
jgi:hypothetical protein